MTNVRGAPAAAAALLAIFLAAAFRQASSLNADGMALLTFKRKLKSDPLNALASWNASHDSPCTSWMGVTCENVADRFRVVALTLPGLRLSGPISPAAIGGLDALRRLSLQNNNLSGAVPPHLLNSSSLTSVLLRHNRFSGSLPVPSFDDSGSPCNVRILDLSENFLSGSIPASISSCSALQSLLLSRNRLTGVIPAGLGSSFRSLEELDLSSNQLVGPIPDDLGRLSSLRGALNLSHNWLSGSVPATLGSFPYMVSLDLSYNNLSGEIPQNGSLAGQPAGAFLGNPQLCGPPLLKSCRKTATDRRIPKFPGNDTTGAVPAAPAPHHAHMHNSTMMLGAGAIVGLVFGNIVAVSIAAVLLVYCCHKSSRRSSTWMAPPKPTRFSAGHNSVYPGKLRMVRPKWSTSVASMAYSRSQHTSASSEGSGSPGGGGEEEKGELVVLDEGFGADMEELLRSSASMVGRSEQGIVYKVVLGSGKAVAVRRLDGGGRAEQGGVAEWRKAAESLGRLRHSNIVRLLAYYHHSAANEKLLIHDFIPHGTLASALFGGGDVGRPLPWTERLTVMERTASALAYIHDHRTAHGDVKSSNILLRGDDDRVTPYLADLGLRKLRNWCSSSSSSCSQADYPPAMALRESRELDHQLSSSIHHYHLPPEAAGDAVEPTEEWDVYGFGVVMMEVVTGRSAAEMRTRAKKHPILTCSSSADAGKDVEDDDNFVDLVSWVRSCLVVRRCSVRHVLDPKLFIFGSDIPTNNPPPQTGQLESEPSHSPTGADAGADKLMEPQLAAAAASVLDLATACTSFLPVHRPRMIFVAHALHNLLSVN